MALVDPSDPAADAHVEVTVDQGGAEDVAAAVLVGPDVVEVARHGQRFVFARPRPDGDDTTARSDGLLTAPMPSVVVDVRVAVGDEVTTDQVLATVEAMKMELAVRAPFAGVVAAVAVRPGQRVAVGAALLTVDPRDPSHPQP